MQTQRDDCFSPQLTFFPRSADSGPVVGRSGLVQAARYNPRAARSVGFERGRRRRRAHVGDALLDGSSPQQPTREYTQ